MSKKKEVIDFMSVMTKKNHKSYDFSDYFFPKASKDIDGLEECNLSVNEDCLASNESDEEIGNKIGNKRGNKRGNKIGNKIGNKTNKGVTKEVTKTLKEVTKTLKGVTKEVTKGVTKTLNSDFNFTFFDASEQQKSILIFIFHECSKINPHKTGKITLKNMRYSIGISEGSIKQQLLRLFKTGLIAVTDSEIGRKGWRIIEMEKCCYDDIFYFLTKNNFSKLKGEQNREQKGEHSSSSYIYNNTTTKKFLFAENQDFQKSDTQVLTDLPSGWDDVSHEELNQLGVDFKKTHIAQIYQQRQSKEFSHHHLQSSIDGFVWDLKNKHQSIKRFKNPVAFLLKISIAGKPYIPHPSYQDSIRRKLEQSKAYADERKRIIDDIIQSKFDTWLSERSKDERLSILCMTRAEMDKLRPEMIKSIFFDHYKQKVEPYES